MKKIILLTLTLVLVFSCSGGGGGNSDVDNQGSVVGDVEGIKGIVRISDNAFFDYDIKDSGQNSNNSFENAQYVSSDSSISGYVHGFQDRNDWFLLNSSGNDLINFIGEIGLIASAGKDLNQLTEFTNTYETTDAGKYYIRVKTDRFSSKGNYKIVVSGSKPRQQNYKKSSYVKGEIVLKLREDIKAPMSLSVIDERLELKKKYNSFSVYRIKNKSVRSANSEDEDDTIKIINQLNDNPAIEFAEPNFIRTLQYSPNDYYYLMDRLWNLEMINAPYAWNIARGDGVIVAVLDTGIIDHEEHPDSRIVYKYDFIESNDEPWDTGEALNGMEYHGPHVSGIIGAQIDNDKGIAGVAPKIKIMPLRVIGTFASSEDIAASIRYASGLSNSSDIIPKEKADIINMSFGGEYFSNAENNAVKAAAKEGVIMVSSAGNNGEGYSGSNYPPIYYPAGYSNVIAVSAVDRNENFTSYSNFGDWIDVSAPGGDNNGLILSVSGPSSSDYTGMAGTSMASPHVAGVIALMKSFNKSLNIADFYNLLHQGKLTRDIGQKGFEPTYGYGLIDAKLSVLNTQGYLSYMGLVVFLMDSNNNIIKKAEALKSSSNKFEFTFSGLKQGTYFIKAGVDLNNDGDFLDLGELSGSLADPVEYNGNDLNLDNEVLISF